MHSWDALGLPPKEVGENDENGYAFDVLKIRMPSFLWKQLLICGISLGDVFAAPLL